MVAQLITEPPKRANMLKQPAEKGVMHRHGGRSHFVFSGDLRIAQHRKKQLPQGILGHAFDAGQKLSIHLFYVLAGAPSSAFFALQEESRVTKLAGLEVSNESFFH